MDAAGILRESGMRATPQRMAIIEYMHGTRLHPTAELVHRHIRERYPSVSLSTVYNTLEALREHRIVHEIEMAAGSRYEWRDTEHVNLVCVRCGGIEDVRGAGARPGGAAAGGPGMDRCMEVRGECGRCSGAP